MDAPPIQYVRTSDGYDIAYCVTGRGIPLVHWTSAFASIQTTWRINAAWMSGLADRFRLICADPRGSGLSQRGLPDDFTFTGYERDVEAIAERFADEPLVFFVLGVFGHPVVRFALRQPQRVRAIVWADPFINPGDTNFVHFGALSPETWQVLLDSMASRYATGIDRQRLAEEFARNFNFEDLRIGVRAGAASSVEQDLTRLKTPLLVLCAGDRPSHPARESMQVAACAANGSLVFIDSADVYGDAVQGIQAIEDFLAQLPAAPPTPDSADALSSRELEVLRLIAAGKSNQQIAAELVISINTVRRHVSNILDKTGAANRAQAVAYARDHELQ